MPYEEYTLGGLDCSIADSPETREQVYRLRHDCYLRKGSIDPRPNGQFSDDYDQAPNNFSFLVRNSVPEPLATVRISVVRPDLGWTESPVRKVFGDHPAFEEVAGESFVEASRLCFGQQARRDVLMRLLGNMAALAEFYDVEWLIACPRMEHSPIYQRLFGFRPLAEPRPYFGVRFETQMLGVRRSELQDWVREARPLRSAWQTALANLASSGRLMTAAVALG
jgi:hypothetical protein